MAKPLTLPITEADVLSGCKSLLEPLKQAGVLTYRRLHTTGIPLRHPNGSWGMRPNVEMAGMPDIEIYLPGGLVLHCECKSTKGRASPEQVAWEAELKALGHVYAVVRSAEELRQVLVGAGVSHWSLG